MASGRATLQSIAVGLAEAMTALLSFSPVQANQKLAQQRALKWWQSSRRSKQGATGSC
jgi:hypothetical protein